MDTCEDNTHVFRASLLGIVGLVLFLCVAGVFLLAAGYLFLVDASVLARICAAVVTGAFALLVSTSLATFLKTPMAIAVTRDRCFGRRALSRFDLHWRDLLSASSMQVETK